MTRWFTGRKVLTVMIFASGNAALWYGKLGGEQYVYLMFGLLAGHHLPTIIAAWRGGTFNASDPK